MEAWHHKAFLLSVHRHVGQQFYSCMFPGAAVSGALEEVFLRSCWPEAALGGGTGWTAGVPGIILASTAEVRHCALP